MPVGLIGVRFVLAAGGVWRLQNCPQSVAGALAVLMGRIAVPCSRLFSGLVLYLMFCPAGSRCSQVTPGNEFGGPHRFAAQT